MVAGAALMLSHSLPAFAAAPQFDAAGIEFFESKVRPVLVDQCYSCHSRDAEKVKGGLWLDTRADLLKGGDTGPALAPGDPEKSLLIKAVRYTDEDLQMPPKGKKLSPEQIAALEEWVRIGAPDPRTGEQVTSPLAETAKEHWAFQPVTRPAPPAVKNARWVRTPVDAFVLAQLEARGMTPNPQADRRALIRRATYDLTGLPPTPEEVDAFEADRSPDAFAKVVERLLASPRYGERWGRHWLDVARYADTKGYVFEEERRYAYAYTYRDYVIRAFNEDLPFDQFIREQLAADLLAPDEDKRALAALGYLTLGRRFINNAHDIIDDRIDVVTRGFMGLTVSCARCHDHKYDPIPTEDYYSLYGVFASSYEPDEKPLLGITPEPEAHEKYLAERQKRLDEKQNFRAAKEAEAMAKLRQQAGEYLLVAHRAKADKADVDRLARESKLDPGIVRRWKDGLESWGAGPHPIFTPWFAYAALPEEQFAEKAREVTAQFAPARQSSADLNPLVADAFLDNPPASLKEVAERYGKLFAEVEKLWQETLAAHKTNAAPDSPEPTALADANREALRQILYGDDMPANPTSDELRKLFDVPAGQHLRALQRKIDELDATHPGAPPRAMALVDKNDPADAHVFVRGAPGNRGEKVPRRFLEILAREEREPFTDGSGRRELAEAIASDDNPLTARVIVNRVWLHHFGEGLVRTPSDFGLRSEPPTHPELLDYLAARFVDDGWSLKKLHRLIMLSSAYQQSSDEHPRHARLDPDNRLLWRMNRRRLDFEAMRDTLLTTAGQLDLKAGGLPVELTSQPFSTRRSVYGYIDRQNLPSMFRVFDFASPDASSPQRFYTTVPQQALFLMNSPFVVEQARTLVARDEIKSIDAVEERVRALYEIALQREPSREELRAAREFIRNETLSAAPEPEPATWTFGYGSYDKKNGRTKQFSVLSFHTGTAYQGGTELPDPQIGWVMLNAKGGHTGKNPDNAAIRRWTAPRDGEISIRGSLEHGNKEGDGVRGRILSSSRGELGEWIAHNGKQETAVAKVSVRKGDAIDFMTDCRGNVSHDTFIWAPVIRYLDEPDGKATYARREWDAEADFATAPQAREQQLDAWQQFAQVLLLSNELAFVD